MNDKLYNINYNIITNDWLKNLNIIYNNFNTPLIIINSNNPIDYDFSNLITTMKHSNFNFGTIANPNTWYIKDRCIKEIIKNNNLKNTIIDDFINLKKLNYNFNIKGVFEPDLIVFINKSIFEFFLKKINDYNNYFTNNFILFNYVINKFMLNKNIVPISANILKPATITNINIYCNLAYVNNELEHLIY